MFLVLWNFFNGYVIIKVTGFSVFRFMNLASNRGVYIYDVEMSGGGLKLKVSLNGLKVLYQCAEKSGCEIEILDEKGLPFLIRRYKKRYILAFGGFAFVIALYVLSSFIWQIEITGNNRIQKEDLLAACDELGLSAGKLKMGIDVRKITNELILRFDDISWISVSIEGTRANVSLVEKIEETEIIDKNEPCEIVASEDGIIERIAVSSGTAVVEEKDVVKKGDLLVSSEIVFKDMDVEKGRKNVHAIAEVFAKVYYDFEIPLSLEETEKIYYDEKEYNIVLDIFGHIIDNFHPKLDGKLYDESAVYDKIFKIGDYEFPLRIAKYEISCYKLNNKTLTEEEAVKKLEDLIEEKIFELNLTEDEIIEKNVEFENGQNEINAVVSITALKRIDEQRKISIQGDS